MRPVLLLAVQIIAFNTCIREKRKKLFYSLKIFAKNQLIDTRSDELESLSGREVGNFENHSRRVGYN